MKFIFVFLATVGLAQSLMSHKPSMVRVRIALKISLWNFLTNLFKNFGMSQMMKRIVSPDAGWDDDFGDLPQWLQDWGNTETNDAF